MGPSLLEPRVDDQGREEEEKTSTNIPRMFLEEEGEVGERPSGHWTRYIYSYSLVKIKLTTFSFSKEFPYKCFKMAATSLV